ncbi:collagen alpha-1(III) chain-like [Perognathus longimembris pacificus]|uniref:collagen alpha-1(III) chain-like n=1 Tax=Perognathus longimembris pacificus TaxID=214514 RepID=UPI00201A1930|nr:collagen alpha-1(III) chain-like [Perognathus longimembris pacificus]
MTFLPGLSARRARSRPGRRGGPGGAHSAGPARGSLDRHQGPEDGRGRPASPARFPKSPRPARPPAPPASPSEAGRPTCLLPRPPQVTAPAGSRASPDAGSGCQRGRPGAPREPTRGTEERSTHLSGGWVGSILTPAVPRYRAPPEPQCQLSPPPARRLLQTHKEGWAAAATARAEGQTISPRRGRSQK